MATLNGYQAASVGLPVNWNSTSGQSYDANGNLQQSSIVYDLDNLFSHINTYEQNSADRYLKDSKSLADYEYQLNSRLANSANAFSASEAEKNRQYQSAEAEIARNFNSAEAQKQRDYETEMSNSAYTRAVQDLKNAGLNPVLALKLSGASTPSAVSASQGSVPSGSAGSPNKASVGSKSARKSELASALVQLITAQLSSSAQEVSAIGSVLSGIGHIIPF